MTKYNTVRFSNSYAATADQFSFADSQADLIQTINLLAQGDPSSATLYSIGNSLTTASLVGSIAVPTDLLNQDFVGYSTKTQLGAVVAPDFFHTSGNQIVDSAGHDVQIAGVNWFGFESSALAPQGLSVRGYKDMMNQMVQLGFNTIRLPFASDTLTATAQQVQQAGGIDFSLNPDLQGQTALQIMDKIVDYAGQIGLRIILDHQRSDLGSGTSANGLWYDATHSDAQWVADWQMLAQHYANNPTVIGADLQNEPYNGTWGGGGPNDWVAAAERAGNAIGAVNPNWLIFVEGIGTYQGQSYWGGGNLMGVRDLQVQLNIANKLVYSAHDFPDSVHDQPWFQDPSYPANLPAKFNQMWGYIYQGFTPTGANATYTAPVWIGEFGTTLGDDGNVLNPLDPPWFKAITAYMGGDFNNDGVKDIPAGQQGPSWTYDSWNPDSPNVGGILANDWQTVNQNKMAYLTPIEFDVTIIQSDYLGIARATLPLDQAATEANAIFAGTTTELQYVNSLLSQVADTTIPAVAVEGSMYNAVGTSNEITKLVTLFLPGQVSNAVAHGLNPQVYACEVVGLAFAFGDENGGQYFANHYGPANAAMPATHAGDVAFAAAAASTIFGSAANAGTPGAILGWVSNWEAFYTSHGIPGVANATASQIDLAARGAAWGDAVGVALANNLGPLPGQVINFLEDAAQGTALYSASLASQPMPAPFQGAAASVANPASQVQLTGVAASSDHAMMGGWGL
jgi:chitinase